MIQFRQKKFSIQEGGYNSTNKRQTFKPNYLKGAGIGAGLGAGLGFAASAASKNSRTAGVFALGGLVAGAVSGAFVNWIRKRADESSFKSPRANTTTSLDLISAFEEIAGLYNVKTGEEVTINADASSDKKPLAVNNISKKVNTKPLSGEGTLYVVNDDPEKHTISAYYSANVLVLYINNPKSRELNYLNTILDKYCYNYKNADYTATKVKNNVYEVEVAVVEGTEADICLDLSAGGFIINIITK